MVAVEKRGDSKHRFQMVSVPCISIPLGVISGKFPTYWASFICAEK